MHTRNYEKGFELGKGRDIHVTQNQALYLGDSCRVIITFSLGLLGMRSGWGYSRGWLSVLAIAIAILLYGLLAKISDKLRQR